MYSNCFTNSVCYCDIVTVNGNITVSLAMHVTLIMTLNIRVTVDAVCDIYCDCDCKYYCNSDTTMTVNGNMNVTFTMIVTMALYNPCACDCSPVCREGRMCGGIKGPRACNYSCTPTQNWGAALKLY